MKNWVEKCRIPVVMGISDIHGSRVPPYQSSYSSSGDAVLLRCHRLDIFCGANHPYFRNPTSEVSPLEIYIPLYAIYISVSTTTFSRNQTVAPLYSPAASSAPSATGLSPPKPNFRRSPRGNRNTSTPRLYLYHNSLPHTISAFTSSAFTSAATLSGSDFVHEIYRGKKPTHFLLFSFHNSVLLKPGEWW